MKICSVQNFNNYRQFFTSSVSVNPRISGKYDNDDEDDLRQRVERAKKNEWLRKGSLGALILWVVGSDPVVQNLFKSQETKDRERAVVEYFEDVQKYNDEKVKSGALYHLNRLADVDKPEITKDSINKYSLNLTLDNGRKVNFTVNLDGKDKNVIEGSVLENGERTKFKAVFSSEKSDIFKVVMQNAENKKYIFGRNPNGALYRVVNGKKIPLNRENVEKYQKELKDYETLDDLKFFTDKNPMWRTLLYLLLGYLVLNEYAFDKLKQRLEDDE